MKVFVGTSGYSYREWVGPFYPPKTSGDEMLRYYGGQFGSVEINNTFYKTPEADVVERWGSLVPASFRFAVKASRRITHVQRLRDSGDSLAYFLERLKPLGRKLGCILVQLPPNAKSDPQKLRDFLEVLPKGVRAAFEFRHASWFSDDVFDALGAKNCALAFSDGEAVEVPFVETADWGYLRLRDTEMDEAALAAWAGRLRKASWKQAFVYFKHEDEGRGPDFARRFVTLLKQT